MTAKKFRRKTEDFVCENCGRKVKGDGYTDHCPFCLYSKHVDVFPGDRRAACRGMMEPAEMEIKNGRRVIHYRCSRCEYRHRVRAAENDDFEKMLEISSRAEKF